MGFSLAWLQSIVMKQKKGLMAYNRAGLICLPNLNNVNVYDNYHSHPPFGLAVLQQKENTTQLNK